MVINIEDLIDHEWLLPPVFLNRHNYSSYIVFNPFYEDELERIASQAGYREGGMILFSLKEGSDPQKILVTTSLDEACHIVFEFSYTFYVIELIPDTLYIWHEPDDDLFIVFGKKEILKKCIDLDEVNKSYTISMDGNFHSEKGKNRMRRLSETYNRLHGIEFEKR